MLAAMIDGMNDASEADTGAPGCGGATSRMPCAQRVEHVDRAVIIELCWGDVGLLLVDAPSGSWQQRDRVGRKRRAARAF